MSACDVIVILIGSGAGGGTPPPESRVTLAGDGNIPMSPAVSNEEPKDRCSTS